MTNTDGREDCRVATLSNIVLSGLQAIDGVMVAVDNRVLVKNQTNAAQNGIYKAKTGSWVRSSDADSSSKIESSMYLFVNEGINQSDTGWILTTDGTIVLGTTALNFKEFTLNVQDVDARIKLLSGSSFGELMTMGNGIHTANAHTAPTKLGNIQAVPTYSVGLLTADSTNTKIINNSISPIVCDVSAIANVLRHATTDEVDCIIAIVKNGDYYSAVRGINSLPAAPSIVRTNICAKGVVQLNPGDYLEVYALVTLAGYNAPALGTDPDFHVQDLFFDVRSIQILS